MSEENVEIVRELFERWKRGDYSETDWADPDIEFVITTPGGDSHRGLEAMRSAWREFLDAWDNLSGEPKQIVDAGDQVLVLTEFGGRGHESGVPLEGMRGAALFRLEDCKVVRLVLFGNWDEGLEAAGLSE